MAITLVGFRGSGKSTVGAQLAARLQRPFVDADTEVQSRAGLTIAQMFDQYGEPWFRHWERQVLAELLSRPDLVLAAGGGAVMDEETRERMRSSGPVVWLQGSCDTLVGRIETDALSRQTRPRLTSATDLGTEVRELLSRREPLYRDVATIMMSTEGRSVTAIVDDIVSQLPLTGA